MPTGAPIRGPIGAVLNPSLLSIADHGDLAYASSLCGACLEACPIRIDLPSMLVDIRNQYAEAGLDHRSVRTAVKLYAKAATRPLAFRALLSAGGLAGKIPRSDDGWITQLPLMGNGWLDYRDFPKPDPRPFHRRWKDRDDS